MLYRETDLQKELFASEIVQNVAGKWQEGSHLFSYSPSASKICNTIECLQIKNWVPDVLLIIERWILRTPPVDAIL